jgi:hypothetical protein
MSRCRAQTGQSSAASESMRTFAPVTSHRCSNILGSDIVGKLRLVCSTIRDYLTALAASFWLQPPIPRCFNDLCLAPVFELQAHKITRVYGLFG